MTRPVILIGNGCRNNPALIAHLCGLGIPVLTTWMSMDLVAEDDPAFCGRPGIFGQRAANIIQQSATHFYAFGARLDGEQVAYDYDRFAPGAMKYIFDCDLGELQKLPEDWRKIWKDLSNPDAIFCAETFPAQGDPSWLGWCKALYARFRPELEGDNNHDFVDVFSFMDALSTSARADDVLAIGSSSGAVNAFLQSFRVKRGQRVTVCASIGAMGLDIPMAIGAALAERRRTICVTGDGGFQLNTPGLEVVKRFALDIRFFVFNNGGYNSIRVMQQARYDGRIVGANAVSGFTTPDLGAIATAYGITYKRIKDNHDLLFLDYELNRPGPAIIEVMSDPEWVQLPRVMASTINGQLRTDDMHDMTPHLPAGELAAIMEWDHD